MVNPTELWTANQELSLWKKIQGSLETFQILVNLIKLPACPLSWFQAASWRQGYPCLCQPRRCEPARPQTAQAALLGPEAGSPGPTACARQPPTVSPCSICLQYKGWFQLLSPMEDNKQISLTGIPQWKNSTDVTICFSSLGLGTGGTGNFTVYKSLSFSWHSSK